MKSKQPKPPPRKGAVQKRDTFALFDLSFKKLIRLSSRAVTAFINGLFGTSYPPDAVIEYPNTETVSAALKRRVGDIFIKIEGHTYNIEIQSTVDKAIIVRIFEAGFWYALDEKTFENGIRTLRLPAARVIQIQETMESPQILRLIFPNGTGYNYEVDVLNLQQHEVREIGERGLALLLPFCVLKLRKAVETAKNSVEREKAAQAMSGLVDSLLAEVMACEKRGVIETQDARSILDWLEKIYEELYSPYEELAEEVDKVNGGIKLYSERLVEEARAETKKAISLETAKRFLAMGDNPEKVAKGTGLSLAKVRALAAEHSAGRRSSEGSPPESAALPKRRASRKTVKA